MRYPKWSVPLDYIGIHQRMLILNHPFKATMMHNGIKSGGDPPKAKSDICGSNGYPNIT